MTTRTKHLDFEHLLEIAERHVAPDMRTESHLAACSQCAKELNRIKGLMQAMQEDESVEAPRDVLSYAINIFSQRKIEQPSLVRRIVAALSFDSFDRAPAFGVRAGGGPARQLLYNAGLNDIELRIHKQANDRWEIAGQVLGENCAGGEIILDGDSVNESALLNEQCEFALPAIPEGNYRLVVKLASVEVELSGLQIGS